MQDAPVLIVGGSVVGLSMALFLAQYNVHALVVERHAGTALHPRSRVLHARTVELFRTSGVAAKLEALGAMDEGAEGDWSPARAVYLGQDRTEPILLESARSVGAEVRFGCELIGFRSEPDCVIAELYDRTSRETRALCARYLVAADGADSFVRERLSIARSGRGSLGHSLAILFDADPCHDMPTGFTQITDPAAAGVLVATDVPGRYIYSIDYDPERDRIEDFTRDRWTARLRVALQSESQSPCIAGVFPWEVAERVAERFSLGRVFLAGDSAHQMPPMGAFGANTGIQDTANLAWKLAWVLRGAADESLLESYHCERHPVAVATAEHAAVSALRMTEPGREATRDIILPDEACVMRAYRYGVTPVIPLQLAAEAARGEVGSRVPHIWLDRARTRSTIDLCGYEPRLISADPRWGETAVPSAHVPEAASALALGASGAALVRPDAIVAARWQEGDGEPGTWLASALRLVGWRATV